MNLTINKESIHYTLRPFTFFMEINYVYVLCYLYYFYFLGYNFKHMVTSTILTPNISTVCIDGPLVTKEAYFSSFSHRNTLPYRYAHRQFPLVNSPVLLQQKVCTFQRSSNCLLTYKHKIILNLKYIFSPFQKSKKKQNIDS